VQSETFYEQVVGLTLSADTIPNHLLFECGDGTTLLVYGRPAPNKADHTQVRFGTDDVEHDVRELESRGAVFEEYAFPTLKTVDHVATTPGIGKSAWFKDPAADLIQQVLCAARHSTTNSARIRQVELNPSLDADAWPRRPT
jgi:catechol 2,3-dioxygenase-like lactoylglutathione lyase family enzyme